MPPGNGRIRGLKMHAVYDPHNDRPPRVEVTLATVNAMGNAMGNDSEIGRKTPIEAGATYVFDKGYCHYGWWSQIHAAGAWFVTRPKRNVKFRLVEQRALDIVEGDGFRVLADREVAFDSKGDSTLSMALRCIQIERQDAKPIAPPIIVLANDMTRPAVEIAALYKARWQIELLFRWIKQHLELSRFLGNNQNAIQLQIIAAMIAYLLLRLAAHTHALTLPALRLAELVRSALFVRKPMANLHNPPAVNPSKPKPPCPNQPEFCYA